MKESENSRRFTVSPNDNTYLPVDWVIGISLLGGFRGNLAMDGPSYLNKKNDTKLSLEQWCSSFGNPSLSILLRTLDYTEPNDFMFTLDNQIYEICNELALRFGKRDKFFNAIKDIQISSKINNIQKLDSNPDLKIADNLSGDSTDVDYKKSFFAAGRKNRKYGTIQAAHGHKGGEKGSKILKQKMATGELDFSKIDKHGRPKSAKTQVIFSGLTIKERLEITVEINRIWLREGSVTPPYKLLGLEIFDIDISKYQPKGSKVTSFKKSIKKLLSNEKVHRIMYILSLGDKKRVGIKGRKTRIPANIRSRLISEISYLLLIKGELTLIDVRDFVFNFLRKRGFTPIMKESNTISNQVMFTIDPKFKSFFSLATDDPENKSNEDQLIITDRILRIMLADANISYGASSSTSNSFESLLSQLLPSVLMTWSLREVFNIPGGEGFILNGDEKMNYRGGRTHKAYSANSYFTATKDICELIKTYLDEPDIQPKNNNTQSPVVIGKGSSQKSELDAFDIMMNTGSKKSSLLSIGNNNDDSKSFSCPFSESSESSSDFGSSSTTQIRGKSQIMLSDSSDSELIFDSQDAVVVSPPSSSSEDFGTELDIIRPNNITDIIGVSELTPTPFVSQFGTAKRTKTSRTTYSEYALIDDGGILAGKLICVPGGKRERLTSNQYYKLRKLNILDDKINKDLIGLCVEKTGWQGDKSDVMIARLFQKLYDKKIKVAKRHDIGYLINICDSLDKHFYHHNIVAAINAGVLCVSSSVSHTEVSGILDTTYMGVISQVLTQTSNLFRLRHGSSSVPTISFCAEVLINTQKVLSNNIDFISSVKKRFVQLLYSTKLPGKISPEERKLAFTHLDFTKLFKKSFNSIPGWRDLPQGVHKLISKYGSWNLVPTPEVLSLHLKKGRKSFKKKLPTLSQVQDLHMALLNNKENSTSNLERIEQFCTLLETLFPVIIDDLDKTFSITKLSLIGKKQITLRIYNHLLFLMNKIAKEYHKHLIRKFSLHLPFLKSAQRSDEVIINLISSCCKKTLHSSRPRGLFSQTTLNKKKKRKGTIFSCFQRASILEHKAEIKNLESELRDFVGCDPSGHRDTAPDKPEAIVKDSSQSCESDIIQNDLSMESSISDAQRIELSHQVSKLKISPVSSSGRTKIIKIKKDGNCLFRCYSEAFVGNQNSHKRVRNICVEYMRQHPSIFRPFFLEDSDEKYGSGLVRQLINMSQNRTWGGQPEIISISEEFNVGTQVWEWIQLGGRRKLKPYYFHEPHREQQIILLYTGYYGRKTHYNLAKDPIQVYPLLPSRLIQNNDGKEEDKRIISPHLNEVRETVNQRELPSVEVDSSRSVRNNMTTNSLVDINPSRDFTRDNKKRQKTKSTKLQVEVQNDNDKKAIEETQFL